MSLDISLYGSLQERENSKQLAVDFDGVIHKNSMGFHDGTIYDEPILGALDAIKILSETYDIIIFTAKAKPDRPLINGKTGKELVKDWLEKHGFLEYIKDITSEKPRAVAYIDDKAIKFESWKKALSAIEH